MSEPLDLDAIKQRHAYLTGEWSQGRGVGIRPDQLTEDIAALIAEVERLRAENTEYRAMIQEAGALLDLRDESPSLVEIAVGILTL